MQWVRGRVRWMLLAGLLVLATVVIFVEQSLHQSVSQTDYPVQRTVKYSFTVKNPNNRLVKKSEIWIYAPIKESAFQHVASVDSTYPYKISGDGNGNQRMTFMIENLPPFATRTITVTARINLSDRGNRIDSLHNSNYLSDGKMLGLTNSAIQRVAQNLKKDEPRETANRIYQWITHNIKQSGYLKNDRGAPDTLKRRSGDCTEFMYLFSALARANGIPTRNMAGFVARENRILKPVDYHNWNEAYIDGEWYLIDTDKQVFMEKSSEYIAMRSIQESTQAHSVDSQSFFASTAEIHVSMN